MTDYQDEIDGCPITGRAIKLTKAGDGLSEALKLDVSQLAIGDEVTVLVKGTVTGPSFKPDKDEEDAAYIRVDNIVASSAKIVTGQAVIEQLVYEHEAAIRELRVREEEKKKGVERIPFDPEEDEAQAEEDGVSPIANGLNVSNAPKGSPRNPHLRSELEDA